MGLLEKTLMPFSIVLDTLYDWKAALQIKIGSDDDLPLEKTLTMHNDVILVDSVFHKNHNQYYYKTFLEKSLYQLGKKLWKQNFLVV